MTSNLLFSTPLLIAIIIMLISYFMYSFLTFSKFQILSYSNESRGYLNKTCAPILLF